MNKYLIGVDIFLLVEDDVFSEDVIFYKFYMNKMSLFIKFKKKKKKKGVEEEEVEDLYGGDDSDNEEIDNLLDLIEFIIEVDDGYDYDDLDNVVNEDDDDLIGNISDDEMAIEMLLDSEEVGVDVFGFGFGESDDDIDIGDVDDVSDDDIDIGDVDDVSDDDDDDVVFKRGKRKLLKKFFVSFFVSFEEYEYLLNDDDFMEEKSDKKDKVG